MYRKPLPVIAVLAVVAALSGCSSGGNASPEASASSAAPNSQQLVEMGRRFAQCARDHGYPNFPDPKLNPDGRIGFPVDAGGADGGKEQLRAIEQIPECKQLADQLQASNPRPAPPSAADIQKLKDFAKCIREHGIPEWPDPDPNGRFPISGTPLENEGKSQRQLTALDACKQYWDKGLAFS